MFKSLPGVKPSDLDATLSSDKEIHLHFHQAFKGSHPNERRVATLCHDQTVGSILSKLEGALRKKPIPTVFFVTRPIHALTAKAYLVERGFRVPKDVALICRSHDRFLEFTKPAITYYFLDPLTFAQRISSVVLSLVQTGSYPAKPHRLMP